MEDNINTILECVLLLKDGIREDKLMSLGFEEKIIDLSKKVLRNIGWLMEANKIDL